MATRRTAPPQPEPPSNGDLATYGKFRDRLALTMVALVIGLIGFIVQDQIRGRGRDQIVVDARITDVEADLRQFKDRVNSQFDERLRMLSDHRERIKAVETEVRGMRSEIVGRLERIESKIDAQ